MPHDLRRLLTSLFGTAGIIGAAVAVVFGLQQVQVAMNGPAVRATFTLATPTVTPTVTSEPILVAAQADQPVPVPSTTWLASAGIAAQPTPQATPTNYPITHTIDFSGDILDVEKTVVIIERPDGARTRYLLPKNVTTGMINYMLMGPRDVLIAVYPLINTGAGPDDRLWYGQTAAPPQHQIIDLAVGLPDEAVLLYTIQAGDETARQYLVPKTQLRTTDVRTLLALTPDQHIIGATYLTGLPYQPAAKSPTGHLSSVACATQAVQYISRRLNVSLADLSTGAFVLAEKGQWPVSLPLDLPDFSAAGEGCITQVSYVGTNQLYQVAFNAEGLLLRFAELPFTDSAACAKFTPALCERLAAARTDERLSVAIWLTPLDYDLLYDFATNRRHSTRASALNDLDQLGSEVGLLIGQSYKLQAGPLLLFLKGNGVEEADVNPWAPVVSATLPVETVKALAGWSEVVSLDLIPMAP
jgi:hypothetical protein